jgi:hypothetical protein
MQAVTAFIFWFHASIFSYFIFFPTGFYSPYRTLAFLTRLLDPQTFGRTPWLGDQSNTRPLPKHRTTQHRNMQTHIHAPSRIRTWDVNVQTVIDSACLRLLGCWDRLRVTNLFYFIALPDLGVWIKIAYDNYINSIHCMLYLRSVKVIPMWKDMFSSSISLSALMKS